MGFGFRGLGFRGLGFRVKVTFRLGTAPTQSQSILGVLLRAIYSHIRIMIQLLLSGGSIQLLGFRV